MATKQRFTTELELGHKGAAVIVPFDPAEIWGTTPAPVPKPWKLGHLVKGTMNGARFEGWIGQRWGRHFILVDDELRRAAKAKVGGKVVVVVQPRRIRSPAAKSESPRSS